MCVLTRWCNVSTGMVGLSGVVYELAYRDRVHQLSTLTCLSVSKYINSLCRTQEVRALIRKPKCSPVPYIESCPRLVTSLLFTACLPACLPTCLLPTCLTAANATPGQPHQQNPDVRLASHPRCTRLSQVLHKSSQALS